MPLPQLSMSALPPVSARPRWAQAAAAAALAAALHPLAALAQPVDGDGLRRCRALADPAGRLACYDALPLPGAAGVAPAAGVRAAPAAAAPTPSPQGGFGLDDRRSPSELQAIDTQFNGLFQGWSPNERIRLANGQVWQVVDGSSAGLYLQSPKVRVRRGALGAYFMEFENSNRSPRVRRVE